MPPKPTAVVSTSRKRTAEMLRRLRGLTRETKMLRAAIDTAQQQETKPKSRRGRG
ncbi:MAG TPA: hypothetical protein VFO21_23260 [Vicinamibacterales bacterium]|nr:hypothetical protein [Vicinamibacterales bacterium]